MDEVRTRSMYGLFLCPLFNKQTKTKMMKKNLLLIVAIICFAAKTNAQVLASDSLALVDFYNSTNMAQSSAVEKWDLSTPINTWYGTLAS